MADILTIKPENTTITGVLAQLSGQQCGRDWHNLLRRARRNNYSLLKQVLVDHVKLRIRLMRVSGIKFPRPDEVLVMDLGCGHPVTYKTYDDIPEQDVPCPCGNPNHWIIRYQDLR